MSQLRLYILAPVKLPQGTRLMALDNKRYEPECLILKRINDQKA